MNAMALPNARRGTAQHARAIAGAVAGAVLLIGTMIAPLGAQPYPHKPLRLIIPFPGGGGGADYVGRVIGQKLAERLGQPVVIENRPGAAGNIGIELVAKAQPDGYTLLVTTPSLTISPSLYKKLNYDAIRDLAPISLVAEVPTVARPSVLPVKSLKRDSWITRGPTPENSISGARRRLINSISPPCFS